MYGDSLYFGTREFVQHSLKGEKKSMLERMREIIAEQLNLHEETIGLETSFKDIWELIPWICLN